MPSCGAFHRPSQAVLVSTERMAAEFGQWRLSNLQLWRKGVNTRLFQPQPERTAPSPPVFLYVGRVAAEKNLCAFLDLDLPGDKAAWCGDGPQRAELQRPIRRWSFSVIGRARRWRLPIAAASVLVFPSRTDTYGLGWKPWRRSVRPAGGRVD